MPIRSLTETLDNLYTTTWQNMKDDVADQIFDGSPFWFWMRQNDRLESVEGGRFLTEPVRYAKSDAVQFISKGDSVALNDREFLTVATDDWRYMVDVIVRFGIDDQQNRGKNQILSLMQAKLDNSRDSMVDTLEGALFGLQAGKAFNGLQNLVANDPTVGTLHGLLRTAGNATWFRNQTFDGSAGQLNYATDPIKVLNSAVNTCSKNLRQDSPDILVSSQAPFEQYWEQMVDTQLRIVNKTLGDAGFQNIEFRGIPWVWSPQCLNTTTNRRVYLLNTRFLKFKYDPMMMFDMTEWKSIPTQVNDRAAQVILAGNLMTSRPRVSGVIHSIEEA